MTREQATPRPYYEYLTATLGDVQDGDIVSDAAGPDVVKIKRRRTDHTGAPGWRLRVTDPRTGKQPEVSFYGSEAEAMRALTTFEGQASAATVAPTVRLKTITLKEWATEWLLARKWKHAPQGAFAGELRPHSTWAKERSIIEAYLLPGLKPDTKLRAVTLQDLRKWIGGLTLLDQDGERGPDPLAPSSKTTVTNVTKGFFADAARELGLTPNPAAELPTIWGTDTSSRRVLIPNLGNVEKLACAMDALWPLPKWARDLYGPEGQGRGDLVRLLAFSGKRWEEMVAFPADHVHRAQKLLDIRYTATESGGKRQFVDNAKTPAGIRPIAIVPQLHDVIDRLDAIRLRGLELEPARAARRAARGRPDPVAPPTGLWSLLVSGERGGFQSYGAWRKKLELAQAASGVDLTAHDLRHVAASILFAAGMDWITIQRQMGHASARETERIYVHVFRDDRSMVAQKLGAKITELQKGAAEAANPNAW